MFVRPVGGVTALADALVAAIGAERVRTGVRVRVVDSNGASHVVRWEAGELEADAVVVATPAFVGEELVPAAAAPLRSIPYVSTSVVLLVYPPGTAAALPDATGFVVPAGVAPMTAATFLSRKWPDPAFGDRAVVRCFVGASGSEDVLSAPDDDIVEAVARHLSAVVPLPERPAASRVVRWPRSMPQYEVGHPDRVRAVAEALPPGIFVAGNAYGGVGVADVVRGANETADRAREHLTGDRTRERG
jgi:oxygen-dependent protoporphyrinogen oxidase